MKFSTRARYGLRLMLELARELRDHDLVHLGRIAGITGLSENYLAQLAIPLKSAGLVIGVSGKHGGYMLSRPPERIGVGEIIQAVSGEINATECVKNPDICLNSSFCEARTIWVILSGRMTEVLDEFTLADLIDKECLKAIREKYGYMELIFPDKVLAGVSRTTAGNRPNRKK